MMGQAKQRGTATQRAEQAAQRIKAVKPALNSTQGNSHLNEETLSLMGLDEQTLSPVMITKMHDVRSIWVLIDGQTRSISEVIKMCFDVGIDLCPDTLKEAMQNQKSATFSDVKRYNEIILNAAVSEFFKYACQELMARAIEFERLVDRYENNFGGKTLAAEESGFITFGPVITQKLCTSFASEIESIRLLSETASKEITTIETVQLIVLVAGLKALRLSDDQLELMSFRKILNSKASSIEEIGETLLKRGIPLVREGLASQGLH